ncbi:TIGR03960 family B12-binding radical SAM protein [Clostridium fessum]|uniref:TIGR03960 family B12-binding radical SAM protein n=1 Tax=Clostridium fessum TaxID=2126740 RepID=UPI0039A19D6F
MRKLALSDEILLKISQPARYIGGEVNMVKKDPSKVAVRFAMCFPDVYEIGMSHLGIQILYDMFNRRDDVYCERVYSPWMDLDPIMREQKIPLFAVESQDPIKKFDFLGITIQYEMCYTNILQVLELSQIPLHAEDRTEEDPIVIGGGPCTYNPEPIAPFFDLFYMGEGEVVYFDLIDRYKEIKARGGSRKEFLEQAAQIPGIYVPGFYDVTYKEDGTIEAMTPNNPHAPQTVSKQLVMDMSDTWYPEKPVVPYLRATQDRVVLEIMRGCIRGCRFCQAGMVYRPVRERSLEELKRLARTMLKSTGHEEISLSSLSSSDYTKLEGIVNFLMDEFDGKGVNVSLPSLRIDAFSLDVMSKVQDVKKSSLTFAPEAGSQRLRNVINKGLTEENILNGSAEAFKGGWNRVKLYFMLGLPTETVEDMQGIAELSEKVAEVYYDTVPKEQRHGKVQVTASTSFFVPKPFTPFQWAPMCTKEQFLERASIVNHRMKEMLNKKSLRYNWHEADVTVLEGVLARGDRKVAAVIEEAYRQGAIYDSWSEYFNNDIWMKAFETCGVDIDFYTTRERSLDEVFPWDFIDAGVTKDFLKREWANAQAETVTPNCRMRCSGCGVRKYGGGVCFEERAGGRSGHENTN